MKVETNITKLKIDIVKLVRRTLINDNKYWTRKNREIYFDIMMGALDSDQVTDLVDFYILNELAKSEPSIKGESI